MDISDVFWLRYQTQDYRYWNINSGNILCDIEAHLCLFTTVRYILKKWGLLCYALLYVPEMCSDEPDTMVRLKHQLCDPFHLQAVMDEHLALNMSLHQMTEIRSNSCNLKGQSYKIFYFRFFFTKQLPLVPIEIS